MRVFFSILVLTLLATGCLVGPEYHPPKNNLKPAFGDLNTSVNTNKPVTEWWKEFHDPELNRLITLALQSNYDIQVATSRIRQSRSQRNLAAADLFPIVDADGSYTKSRGSKNVELPLGGATTGSGSTSSAGATQVRRKSELTGNDQPSALNTQSSPFGKGGLPGAETDLYQVGFDASWEIDVFGGKRRAVQAAAAEVQTAVESRHALQVSLAAETARDYIEFRGAQERLGIAQSNLAAQQDILKLISSRHAAGLTDDLDVIRAKAQVAATAATIPPVESDVRRLIHALSILVGREPDALNGELQAVTHVPEPPPDVPVGLPSELVQRRADIRQAERSIAAASARIGVAQSDLFPKFALIANAGLDSSKAENLINWESRYFLISPTVTWRIFDAGRVMANIQLQRAGEEQATLQYRSSILNALREVEDSLVTYATERVRHGHLADEAKQNQDALNLARQRYDQGLTDFINVLDAERTVLSAQDELSQSHIAISTDLVSLYKALGGGWN